MFDPSIVIGVALRFLQNLPSHSFVLGGRGEGVAVIIDGVVAVVESVDYVFGPALGGVAVFPGVADGVEGEDVVEGFGRGGWGDGGGDGEGTVEGEEFGEGDV